MAAMERTLPPSPVLPEREACTYTSCYCEENVWKLCEFVRDLHPQHLEEVYAVFLSNNSRAIPLWKQRLGKFDEPVVWDYHVILLHVTQGNPGLIYDLDSLLPFPCTCEMYIREALKPDHEWDVCFRRNLRVIRADEFLRTFASDRSHMKDHRDKFIKPPPPYPCIRTAEATMNLDDFISMDPVIGWGMVYTVQEFTKEFCPGV
ncbi:protein N-terminal glutamine amidohydrolase [Spea bombifrons]|uniref:protein N-terminal glutamine amidohydrolase n=1 Tax=Spea bombifrons TaxID=233779 RepID=UPI00234B6E1C|nr:protein N-terminal glutamine amidohydrolase [Spea bombifrons]